MCINRKYILSIVILSLLIISFTGAEEELIIVPQGGLRVLQNSPSDAWRLQLDFTASSFNLHADMSMLNDNKYTPSEVYMLGRYFYLNENSISYHNDFFNAKAGRLIAESILQTPYSLYISSMELPSVGMEFTYDGDLFFYSNRWIQLNERSAITYWDSTDFWRDRGFNHKIFGIKLGSLRFGFQDSVVYLDRSFDFKYFLSPMPMYFVQLTTTTAGKPWTEQNNDNSLMGFFADYEDQGLYLYSQLLIDDINASILPWVEADNLDKVAWSLGGSWETDYGKFGFYHAGATKYTFAATYAFNSYSDLPYEFTYYPATEYMLGDGSLVPLPYEENYIGYKYGENNLAFMITYENSFFKETLYNLHLNTQLEWVLNGSKSPANPWHEYNWINEIEPHQELLTDAVVEQLIKWKSVLTNRIKDFEFRLDLMIGGSLNTLTLKELVTNEPKIFVPTAGKNEFLFDMKFTVAYYWKVF